MGNQYEYWLHRMPGAGDKTLRRLVQRTAAQEVYQELRNAGREDILTSKQLADIFTPKQLAAGKAHALSDDLEREWEELNRKGIQFLTLADTEYPERLRQIPDPPYGLYVLGKAPREDVLSVAIIGARECSEYGRYVGRELGGYLGREGVQVISGMARGIDGIAQEAALQAGGASYGVLGCGADICYPADNRVIYDTLVKQGGILSSFVPGTMPKPSHFPPRNRIVSGLADVLVVVEARQKSGTLITVDMALEQGREVYVVPGRVTDRLSDGCNKLLKMGAGVLLSPVDFLREMGELFPEKKMRQAAAALPAKEVAAKAASADASSKGADVSLKGADAPLEAQICAVLDCTPLSTEQIMERLREPISYAALQTALVRLCLRGTIKQASPGFYVRERP